MGEKIHVNLPHLKAELIGSVREETSRTVEDFLARGSRALLEDAIVSYRQITLLNIRIGGQLVCDAFVTDSPFVDDVSPVGYAEGKVSILFG